MEDAPLVTVIVPCRNEQDSIGRALRSVLDQTYPLSAIEVVVVDGYSEDETADVAKRILDGAPLRRFEVIGNPERRTPSNLNRGLTWSEGEIIVRVDARASIPADYVRRLVEVLLSDDGIVVAGGSQVSVAVDTSAQAIGIARALNNRYAMGWSRYRRPGAASGPTDTVYLGVFDGPALREVGGWSTAFSTNQDFELNRRLGELGTVWFEGGLPVDYEPRASIRELAEQYHRFGRWKAFYWARTGDRPQRRQQVILGAPVGALVAAVGAVRVVGTRATLGGALAAALLVEQVGTGGPAGGLRARLASIVAMAAVAGGWWSGVVRGVISGGERPGVR